MDYNVSNMKPVKECKECGKELKGRSDKKFCDSVCRNTYNNRSHSINSSYVRNVNSILKNNRKILKSFVEQGIQQVQLQLLQSVGFDFQHVTAVQRAQDQDLYYCYELGYVKSENKESITILISDTF